jgi:serine/threonine-protein kinase
MRTMLFPRAASDPITVGPYRLTQCIGQGGMAVVYKAKRQGPAGFEKTVVVKAMLPGLVQRKELVDLFRAEAKLSAQLSHPNIVQVHDFGVADGVPFLVMEYLNGRNLTQLRGALAAATGGKLPVGAALAVAREVCHALAYAHDFTDAEGNKRQIIHRDVSPSNVMLCRDGMVKLLDFGVAKVAGEFDCDVTQSFRGKYAYMAPEQVLRQPIDRRVDVFALGIVLHEMLTGKRLFAAPSELETLERVSAAQVVAPSVDNHDVPRALDAIVKRALSRDPNARFYSGAEMGEELEKLDEHAWTRRKLQGWLAELFPDAYTVTCEICGKQVVPGEICGECGEDSPETPAPETVLPSLTAPPVMPESGPLPLPPPPRGSAKLRLVRTPVDDLMEKAPPGEATGLHPRSPENEFESDTGLGRQRPTIRLRPANEPEHVEAASPPPPSAPVLFVVGHKRRGDEDSVKMGRPKPPAPQPPLIVPFATPAHGLPETIPMPKLRKGGLSGMVLALLAVVALGGLGVAVLVARAPTTPSLPPPAPIVNAPIVTPVVSAPVAAPAAAPKTVAAPVVVTATLPAPKHVAPPPARPVAHKKIVRKAEPPAPRTSVRQGGLVDPFAGSD